MSAPRPPSPSPHAEEIRALQAAVEAVRQTQTETTRLAQTAQTTAQHALTTLESSQNAADLAAKSDTENDARDKAIDFLWRTYGAIAEWIRFADVKAGATLAANAALVAAGASTVEKQADFISTNWVVGVLLVLVAGCLLGSSWFALNCISPMLALPTPAAETPAVTPPKREPLVYFADIHAHYKNNGSGYAAAVLQNVLPNAVILQIAAQVVANAAVASSKHNKIKCAVRLHTIALFLAVCSLITGLTIGKMSTPPPKTAVVPLAPTSVTVTEPIMVKVLSSSPSSSPPKNNQTPAAQPPKGKTK